MSTTERAERQDPLSFYLDKSGPAAWKAVGGLSTAAKEAARAAGLDDQLVELVNLRVSQINGCAYCLHVHTRRAIEVGLDDQRRGLVAAWEDADVYSEQEKAALALAEVVTTLPGTEDRDATQMLSHAVLTDEQYSAVQWLAITMNVTNRISILSHHPVRRAPQAPGL
ncbi:carboxymuconolactone decarboxylase family protein [Citricoccus sp. SGAir0253]|uniref:carboxymuconolactone decarboxylase family protein n=1 Tax=Citricoccus sp. SGAir0253 TaxID=2567881 RepID=UPI0010CD1B43|nr:carboxymuconolactone decarboxylase family protein [Citricoccus sp. SGAir0253]QCU78800.1 carboxymuconolactone decarboxylase family protein [Citricoccus sp. SGAir0253]